MAKKRTVDSGKLKGVVQQLHSSMYKATYNQLGKSRMNKLNDMLTNPLRRPYQHVDIVFEIHIKKYLRQAKGKQPWNPLNAKSEDQTIRQSPSS